MTTRVFTVQTQAVYSAGSEILRSVTHDSVVTQEASRETPPVWVFTVQTQVVYTAPTFVDILRTVEHASIVSHSVSALSPEEVSHEDILSHSVDVGKGFELEQDLNLFDFAQAEFKAGHIVSSDLNLQQDTHVFGYEFPEHDLGLIQSTLVVGPVPRNIDQPLNVVHSVEASFGLRWDGYDTGHDVGLTDAAFIPIILDVEQPLGLQQEAFESEVVDHDLSLNSLAEWGWGYSAANKLGLSHSAANDLVLNQELQHDDVLSQASTYFIESPCAAKEWGGFHGEGGVAPPQQKLQYNTGLTLRSVEDPDNVLELRNPETDDRRRYAFQRVSRDFMDGTADIFADDNWVDEQTQIYTIVAVKRADLDTVWQFLLDNLGKEVIVKDWKGASWRSVVVNPGEVYTEDAEKYWTLDFELVGDETDYEYAAHDLSLAEQLSRAGSIWTRSVAHEIDASESTDVNWNRLIDADNSLGLGSTATATVV